MSEQAEGADLHLQLRAGTDAAMALGWLKVIFDEELYDKEFVRDWCVGFDKLRARVDEYPLERVEAITGVDRDRITQAARMYATASSACGDSDDLLDLEQGTPHFRGYPGRLTPIDPPAEMSAITLNG